MKLYDILTENEKRIGLFEMRVRLNDIPPGSELPDGSVVFGYNDSIWVVAPTDWSKNKQQIVDDISQKMQLDNPEDLKAGWSVGLLMDFADTRSDVVAFSYDGGRLRYRRHPFGQSPQTSPLFKKVSVFIKQQFGLSPRTFSVGAQFDTGSDREENTKSYRGALPREGYHGTNLDALASILKSGITPQSAGNYGEVHTPGYIFFAADDSGITHRYAMHSAGGMWTATTFPVLIHFKIPDQDLIKPDVDTAHNLYGKDAAKLNPDYEHLPFKDKEAGETNSTKGQKNPERMWKHGEMFGYKGRIPASYIVSFTTVAMLGGANTSKEQMVENIRAWNYLKSKYKLQQMYETKVSWVGKSAEQIIKEVTAALENTNKE